MRIVLRGYQADGVARAEAALATGPTLLVAPTGSGKTVMAAAIADKYDAVLVVAHRRELIGQSKETMARHVTSMSVQRALNHGPSEVDLLIIDEAHRADAATYRKLIAKYPNAARLGLTATPWRTDGKGLKDAFSEMVCVSSVKDLVASGDLVPYTALEAPDEALQELKRLKKRGGDYDAGELSALMNTPRLVGKVVDEYRKHALGVPAIAFAVSVKHSLAMAAAFRKAGVRAIHIDGKTREDLRDEVTAKLSSDKIDVVCNVNLFTEGWDCTQVACVIMARPTQSLTLYLQCVGRGMRPDEEYGKTGLLILDHAGNMARHGYPDEDREWSLEGRAEKAAKEATDLRLQEIRALGFDSLEQYELAVQHERQNSYSAAECDAMFGGKNRRRSLFRKHDITQLTLSGGTHRIRYSKELVDNLNLKLGNSSIYSLAQCSLLLEKYFTRDTRFDPNSKRDVCKLGAYLKRLGVSPVSFGAYSRVEVDALIERLARQIENTYSRQECAGITGSDLESLAPFLKRRGVLPSSLGRYPKEPVDLIGSELSRSYSISQVHQLLPHISTPKVVRAFLRRRGIRQIGFYGHGKFCRYDKAEIETLLHSLPKTAQSSRLTPQQDAISEVHA